MDNRLTTVCVRKHRIGLDRLFFKRRSDLRAGVEIWYLFLLTRDCLMQAFCQAIILALDIIDQKHEPGVVITTSGIAKFYSNGLDLEHANYTPGFWKESLYALWLRLITYPMPTVALVNGHAFAAGFMLAMMHDYRIMNPHKGYLCLNELELGVPLRPPMLSVFRQKNTSATLRKMILEVYRFKVSRLLPDEAAQFASN